MSHHQCRGGADNCIYNKDDYDKKSLLALGL